MFQLENSEEKKSIDFRNIICGMMEVEIKRLSTTRYVRILPSTPDLIFVTEKIETKSSYFRREFFMNPYTVPLIVRE